MLYLKLAWRNLWRNKRRTFITMASVFFAVILSTLMMSLKEGVYVNMIDSMVGTYTGYAQVHADGYWEEQTLNNSFEFTEELEQKIVNTPGVRGYLPRVESFALSAAKELTKGALVVGVYPQKEKEFNSLQERVSAGEYFAAEDKAVLIGNGLAKYLKLGVGDTIVMIGQGYHGASAAGKYPIKGIVKFGSPELSKQLIFLPMKEAMWYFGMENTYSSLILQLEDPEAATSVVNSLEKKLGDKYEVMDWKELIPDIMKMIEADRVEGYVFMFILYMVISFGIFGTVLMMLAERKHEFGVLVAIGMKRVKLAVVVWMEVIIISLLGAFFGMLGAFPVCYYFYANPIDIASMDDSKELQKMTEDYGMEAVIQASVDTSVFLQQATIVFIVASIIAIYPFINIVRMNAIKAMRN